LPPRAYTSGEFEGIPPEGVGGDPDLNVLKNRDRPPKQQYVSMTLEEIIAQRVEPAPEVDRAPRRNWSEKTLAEITRIENQGVIVEGYIARLSAGGRTAANAGRRGPRRSDWSLSLVADPSDEVSKAVVAVVSPRVQSAH